MSELNSILRIGFALIYSPRVGARRAGQCDLPATWSRRPPEGFTLIELSIVLVIIGLIAGAVLTGRDLIEGARLRAQISQIDQLNTAMRTFQNKYGYLPGDMPDPAATGFGFPARGQFAGQGDGNGVIEGNGANAANWNGGYQLRGESVVAWVDLSIAGLIQGGFHWASETAQPPVALTLASSPGISDFFPQARIGNGNYIYIFEGDSLHFTGINGYNYWGIEPITQIGGCTVGAGEFICAANGPGMTVQQAYNIDSKIDDGYPQTGRVLAIYQNYDTEGWQEEIYAQGGPGVSNNYGTYNTNATAPSSVTCFDNGNVNGTQHYSTQVNGGAGMNCALGFQFQ